MNSMKIQQKFTLIILLILLCLTFLEYFYGDLSGPKIENKSIQNHEASDSNKAKTHSNVEKKIVKYDKLQTVIDDSEMNEVNVIILWWTQFIGELEYTKNCGDSICRFTGNRKYFNHEKLKVSSFYFFSAYECYMYIFVRFL